MIDNLSDDQIDHILSAQVVGRLGCHAEGKTYVIPIAYVFDGSYVYAHSRMGTKVAMMRKNRRVCFQVDVIHNMANWRSVMIDGEYEELQTTNALQARRSNC